MEQGFLAAMLKPSKSGLRLRWRRARGAEGGAVAGDRPVVPAANDRIAGEGGDIPPPRPALLATPAAPLRGIAQLDALFHPRTVAVIGASEKKRSVGTFVLRNLLGGDFKGAILPVNPKRRRVQGIRCFESVAALPVAPDLALICTKPGPIPALIEALGERGCKAVVVLTAEMREATDADGVPLLDQMMALARHWGIRLLGPNSVGLQSAHNGLNASFAPVQAKPGRIAFVSQSGGLANAVLDWAAAHNIGFAKFMSLGDASDIDFGDIIDLLATDPHTRAILLHVESIGDPRRFLSAARAAARNKPIVAIKSGRGPWAATAAARHSGAVIGDDGAADAALRRAGIVRVETIDELFAAAETLSRPRRLFGERLAVLTNGGGAGIMALDALARRGGRVATLARKTLTKLNKILPPSWSGGNPVDMSSDADPRRFGEALRILLADPGVDAVLTIYCPLPTVVAEEVAGVIIEAAKETDKNLLACFPGGDSVRAAQGALHAAGLPNFTAPENAVAAFMHMVEYRRSQEILMETPPAVPEEFVPDVAAARTIIEGALDAGRRQLTVDEAQALLAAYDLPSADLTTTPGIKLLLGAQVDPVFGPVLRFGRGGAAAEAIGDIAYALPPLNLSLAREVIGRTRIGSAALRDPLHAPFDVEQAALILVKLSQAVVDLPALRLMTLNPVRLGPDGVQIGGAGIGVAKTLARSGEHLAIRPYPQNLVRTITLRGGREITIRPIRPEDEPAHMDFFARLTPEDIRLRFFGPMSMLEHRDMARFTQIDYDREMAFVATMRNAAGQEETLGVVRAVGDPDNHSAEFAVIIRSDQKGLGLGRLLMLQIISYCRARGTRILTGDILRENRRMRQLAQELGFVCRPIVEADAVRVELDLTRPG